VDLLTRKYEAPEFLQFDQIKEPQERFKALIDTIFSLEWSRTVDPGVHFGFYYLSFRNEAIRGRFKEMFKRFRDYLITELGLFQKEGVIRVRDLKMAADYLVTLMEGLEFHAQFLSEGQPFERFAQAAKQTAVHALKNGTI
jgi:hypothetical protein